MVDLADYIDRFSAAVATQTRNKELTDLLTLNPANNAGPKRAKWHLPNDFELHSVPQRYHEVIRSYLKMMQAVYVNHSLREAFVAANDMCTNLIRAYQYETNHLSSVVMMCLSELKAMYLVSQAQNPEDLTSFEYQEVAELGGEPYKASLLEEFGTTVNRGFKVVLNDKPAEPHHSKRSHVYFYLGMLLKIYFKLGKLELARSVEKAVIGSNFALPKPKGLQIPYAIEYWYYSALLSIDDGDYAHARDLLSRALKQLGRLDNVTATKNYARLMLLLIALSYEAHFRLKPEAWDFVPELVPIYRDGFFAAINDGDIARYEQLMEKYQLLLLRNHLYVLFVRLRSRLHLNLVRKTTKLVQPTLDEAKRHIISFDAYQKAFAVSSGKPDSETAIDDLECVLASLIGDGKVKGYLSHVNRCIVLSKTDPFPSQSPTPK
ncbi:hypothetical protein DIURU_004874 [Diutina rugosa]|uniref:PCI domain-containing protein n=1 Tax=Diutina rugosa TaxID=5481 RepID=A0A642UFI1_DIURU|nr:uncharacterized protein DIURU_004874 [Diutina rugosa]KAA8898020.1 hypothetical protein DIURU_004874 [Diutina rugosa]